jgi:hypothetical protein
MQQKVAKYKCITLILFTQKNKMKIDNLRSITMPRINQSITKEQVPQFGKKHLPETYSKHYN